MDAYRDTHGHFVSKDDNGEQCPHNDGKFMNGLRKGLEGKTVEAHGAELKAGGDNSISDVTMDFKKTADDLVGSTDTSRYDRNFESRAKAKLKEMFDGKSAEASEAQGSKPMSKWTREDLMDELLQEESLEPFQKKFEGLSFAALKRVALYQDGWHHVGKFATPTDFYAVNSPAEIVMNLKKERNRNKKLRKGLEKGFADGTEH